MVLKREEDLKKLSKKIIINLSHKKVNNNKTVKVQMKITTKTFRILHEHSHQLKIAKHVQKEINSYQDFHYQTDFLNDRNPIQLNNSIHINKNLKLHNRLNNLFWKGSNFVLIKEINL